MKLSWSPVGIRSASLPSGDSVARSLVHAGHPCDGATEPLPPSTPELCSFADVGFNNANSANACAYRSSCVGSVSSSRTTPPVDANPSSVMFSPCWDVMPTTSNGPARLQPADMWEECRPGHAECDPACQQHRSVRRRAKRRLSPPEAGPSRLSGCPEDVAWTVPRERVAVDRTLVSSASTCLSAPFVALRAHERACGAARGYRLDHPLDRVDLWEAESWPSGKDGCPNECTQCCTSTWLRMCREGGYEPPT